MSEPKRNAPRPHGPGRGMMPTEKAKDFKGSFKKLISYLSPFKFKILIVVIFAAFSTVFTIVGPKILAKATDELTAGLMRIITGAAEGIDFGYIAKVLLFLVGLYALSALFSYIQGFTMSGVSAKVSYNMRRAIMEKIDRLPVSYFHKTSQGDVLSRITNDVDTLSQSLNQSITQLITSVCSIIGVLIMMLSISWQLTLVALCIVPISLLLVGRIVKSSQKYFVGQQEYLGAVNGHVEEMYGGHVVVKAFNGEARSMEKFECENEKLYNAGWKSEFLSGLMQPIMGFVGNLGYVVVCILGASMAASAAFRRSSSICAVSRSPSPRWQAFRARYSAPWRRQSAFSISLMNPRSSKKHRNTPWKTAISAATFALTTFASATKTPTRLSSTISPPM